MSSHTNYCDLTNLNGLQDNKHGLHLRLRFISSLNAKYRGILKDQSN